ncbi:hypothetical protein CAOG_009699 [Capsaspora owczarzaki ATCC 30864]|uniref:Uncharacterized protein n=1 Tax=Capsaspora owczarzaki (strain ATCC 30864) TaxID=595528 RepID=A0A0D2WNM4_CAPO3|nr:hypothetical protein CAOG_009699 [Capsaspora owczarzaki ATCC 30864]
MCFLFSPSPRFSPLLPASPLLPFQLPSPSFTPSPLHSAAALYRDSACFFAVPFHSWNVVHFVLPLFRHFVHPPASAFESKDCDKSSILQCNVANMHPNPLENKTKKGNKRIKKHREKKKNT